MFSFPAVRFSFLSAMSVKKYYQIKFLARFGLRVLEEVAFIFLSGGRVYFVRGHVLFLRGLV